MYYPKKQPALDAAVEIEKDERVAYAKVALEPDNGWVVIVVPKIYDILDLGDQYEVQHPSGHRLSPRFASHKKYVRKPKQPKERKPAQGPKPVFKAVLPPWEVAKPSVPAAPQPAKPAAIKKPWE